MIFVPSYLAIISLFASAIHATLILSPPLPLTLLLSPSILMCGPTVWVLWASATGGCDKRRQTSVGLTKPQVMPTSDLMPSNNNNGIELPIPANTTTKLEAALILSGTKKGSPTRGNMMTNMICLGYVPTTKRSLQRLLQRMEREKLSEMMNLGVVMPAIRHSTSA